MAICEAYITFLERDGDNGAYWRVLTDAGITRERLEGFDRPIKVRARQAGAVGAELAAPHGGRAGQSRILHTCHCRWSPNTTLTRRTPSLGSSGTI